MRVLSRLLVALLILTSFPAPLIAEEVVETEDKDTAISSGAEVGEELNDTTDPLEEFNENKEQVVEDQNAPKKVTDVGTEVSEEKQDFEKKENSDITESTDEKAAKDPDDEVVEETNNESEMVETEMSEIQTFQIQSIPSIEEQRTSRLAHIRSTSVKIYEDLTDLGKYKVAGTTYTHHVYYVKKQATLNNEIYYLISTQPSSVSGTVGWVKSSDLTSYRHLVVDKEEKTFYVKGTGSAYSKAWGGRKDYVYPDLSNYQGQVFKVHLTESVGNEIWYRGVLDGKTVWIHSNHVFQIEESRTSRLGHIRSSEVTIYKDLSLTSSFKAGSTYTHHVYYIKRQALVNGDTYYLISKQPSSVSGTVGWVKSSDLTSYRHLVVDKEEKTFYVKGTGSAYSKAWGGRKDYVYPNLSNYQGQVFKVHLTESVGNEIWYRGVLGGKTVWIHSNHVFQIEESRTSRLGHIRSSEVTIYKDLSLTSSFKAGSTYTHHVYYIKRQALINGDTYYLISKQPSSVRGTVGWVKSSDLTSYRHLVVDKEEKTFYVKGTGSAYSKAWGGRKDYVYPNLSNYKGQVFKVHLTESVGNEIWYRGILGGKTVWIHPSHLSETPLTTIITNYTGYNLTLNRMLDIQMSVNPQTDKRYKLWIREDAFKAGSIRNGNGVVEGDNWNLRRGPGTSYLSGGKVNNGTILTLYSSTRGTDGYIWYHVLYTSGWVIPDRSDVLYYLNPTHFTSFRDSLQFAKLSSSANLQRDEVNGKILKGKGILDGKAQAFIDAGKTHGVNEIYLISHALLETGNGSSTLATGVTYKGKVVYNMYGIGAYDGCAVECGAKYAYEAGWFTPEDAIIGGAAFVGKNYIQKGQDTLYKMRWNPEFASKNNYATHQYATDIGWALKQTARMNNLYNLLDSYTITLDIPKYQ